MITSYGARRRHPGHQISHHAYRSKPHVSYKCTCYTLLCRSCVWGMPEGSRQRSPRRPKNALPPEMEALGRMGLQSTQPGGGEQLLPPHCVAQDRVKGARLSRTPVSRPCTTGVCEVNTHPNALMSYVSRHRSPDFEVDE